MTASDSEGGRFAERSVAPRFGTFAIQSVLAQSALTDSAPLVDYQYQPTAVMPDVKVVKIGGQSIMDRGRVALFPLLDELVAAKEMHPLLVCCGGGTRARHIYAVASDLEMPTGVLAALGAYVPRQNARMLQMLLARHGGIFILHEDFEKLPLYLKVGCIPIMTGMPPFSYWEKPGSDGRIPANRTDAGVFLSAEFLGVRRAVFVKDEDGLYEADPKKQPGARHIPRIGACELLARDLPDLVVERVVIEYLARARFCHELQIINGLRRGMLTRALAGEDVGTIIVQDERPADWHAVSEGCDL
jgi:molybdenum storage protein